MAAKEISQFSATCLCVIETTIHIWGFECRKTCEIVINKQFVRSHFFLVFSLGACCPLLKDPNCRDVRTYDKYPTMLETYVPYEGISVLLELKPQRLYGQTFTEALHCKFGCCVDVIEQNSCRRQEHELS